MAAHAGRDHWRARARLLLAPREQLLPAVGARLGRRPRLAAAVLGATRRLPGRRLRVAARIHLAVPLVDGMRARLDVPLEGGGRMLVDTADVTGRMLAASGVWEPHVTAVFRQLLRPGDVVVDVGANIGYFTLVGARLVGEQGCVHALEPSPGLYAALLANVGHARAANVVPHRVAAGAATGTATLRDVVEGTNRGASSLRSDPERGWGVRRAVPVDVSVRTVAEVVPRAQWPRLRLVKIDVEGFEVDVLHGLEPILEAGHRPAVVVEVHSDIDRDAAASVAELATRYGLRMRRIVDRADLDRIAAASRPVLEDVDPAALVARPDPRIDVLLTDAP